MPYNKYSAKKTVVDGKKFDSKAEARRYSELMLLQRSGKISDLKLQKTYQLIPRFTKNGITYRAVNYIADFEYIENGSIIVEDVKGFRTDVYKIKRKLFEYVYPDLTIKEIT